MQEFAVEAVKQELGISNNTKGFGFLCIYSIFPCMVPKCYENALK